MNMLINNLISIAARKLIHTGQMSNSKKWQGIDNPNPLYQAIKVYLGPAIMPEQKGVLALLTECSALWAEEHFQERISGIPSNPGKTYKSWPFYNQDEAMRKGGIFTHTYMERFWPKHAVAIPSNYKTAIPIDLPDNHGIRYDLGDLNDLIRLFIRDPETRQAYLPVWFPEDTGAVHGGRVPCTLGYLFQIVNDRLHMTYYIRSCDFYRHFRDDIYHAIRLAQHILLSLKISDARFNETQLGLYDMHIGSLHIFNAEVNKLKKEYPNV